MEGSGYFLINSSTQDLANITYLETESAIQVSAPVVRGLGDPSAGKRETGI